MRWLFLSIATGLMCPAVSAERPWWVEHSFAQIDLNVFASEPTQAPVATVRLPSVLTLIQSAAERHDIDPDLLRALVAQESAYDPGAVSEDGAVGLGQLMPVVANWCGISNRFHRVENINCAARHLRVLLTKYDGDKRLALAAYNAGEPAVDKFRCIPNYAETENYVARIMLLRTATKAETL